MGWISRSIGWKLDPVLLRLTGGRFGFGFLLPTALLETRGARTGQPRRRHPDVRVGGQRFRAERVVYPGERARLWHLADRVFPAYASYRDRAAEAGRQIPLVRLHPA